VLVLQADVSKARDCERMVAAAEREFGRLNVLFNNAGIMHPKDDDAIATDESVWDLTLDVNAKGVFLGCKHGIPALRRAGGGSVINTASFVARMGAATPQIAYTASKGAVLAMTRELAVIHAREKHPGQRAEPRAAQDRAPHELPQYRGEEEAPASCTCRWDASARRTRSPRRRCGSPPTNPRT
jgi:NAD(P)-dependent dehydrogenase (short-subunit alcohol dehydrogenase family)